jgi:hypothetical protein
MPIFSRKDMTILMSWSITWTGYGAQRLYSKRFPLFVFCRQHVRCGMKEDQQRFLSLVGQLPARLTAEQTGWVLNCQPHDIPALVTARLIKPLGNPAPNAIKFYCTIDILELRQDRSWLIKMTNAINQHWHRKNARNNSNGVEALKNGHSNGLETAFLVKRD